MMTFEDSVVATAAPVAEGAAPATVAEATAAPVAEGAAPATATATEDPAEDFAVAASLERLAARLDHTFGKQRLSYETLRCLADLLKMSPTFKLVYVNFIENPDVPKRIVLCDKYLMMVASSSCIVHGVVEDPDGRYPALIVENDTARYLLLKLLEGLKSMQHMIKRAKAEQVETNYSAEGYTKVEEFTLLQSRLIYNLTRDCENETLSSFIRMVGLQL